MGTVDYFQLLQEGPGDLSAQEWEEIVLDVVRVNQPEYDPDIALETLQNTFFELTGEWVDRRTRIVNGARERTSDPGLRSKYCLVSLRLLVTEECREAAHRGSYPEFALVHRQVADHLREMRAQGVLLSFKLTTKKGRDLCVLWALVAWGNDARQRERCKELEEVIRELPVIYAYQEGKGIFDYSRVIPRDVPDTLDKYGAPLATAQITFTIVERISPPISSAVEADFDEIPDWSQSPFETHAPEAFLQAKESGKDFRSRFDDREMKVILMKKDEKTIREIAEALGCSKRAVNDLWKGILQKAADCLSLED